MGKMLIEMVHGRKDFVSNKEIPDQPSPINTNNPRLNSVLAETARNFKPIPKDNRGSLAELLDGGFDKIGSEDAVYDTEISQPRPTVVSDGTNVGFLKQIVSEGVTNGAPQQSVLGTNAVPDVLKGVFKKDFRAVMKKIDEQKKFGSSGLINPQMVLSG
jgi:hypothetical protein